MRTYPRLGLHAEIFLSLCTNRWLGWCWRIGTLAIAARALEPHLSNLRCENGQFTCQLLWAYMGIGSSKFEIQSAKAFEALQQGIEAFEVKPGLFIP